MNPYFFGKSSQLFGVFHKAQRNVDAQKGIVLCYPMSHEYLYVHRAYQQLAKRLSRAGFNVLRFDYYGSGDSLGDCEQATTEQWLLDIAAAIQEMHGIIGAQEVSLVGFHLGATLAALAAAREENIASVVLWEPVLNGVAYLGELEMAHASWLSNNLSAAASTNGVVVQTEVMGTPLTDDICNSIRSLDLMSIGKAFCNNILVVVNEQKAEYDHLLTSLKKYNDKAELQHVPESASWVNESAMYAIHVPVATLQAIVTWFNKVSI